MARWFPSPAKFWVALFIILFTCVIYSNFQEYQDVRSLQDEVTDLDSHLDVIEDGVNKTNETVIPEKKPVPRMVPKVSEQPRVVVRHRHYERPFNPIGSFLGIFNAH